MKKYISQKFHNWIIKKLTNENDGRLNSKDINQEKKIIDFGLYSMHQMFFEPKHELYVQMLVKWYGYKVIEQQFEIKIIDWKNFP